MSNVVSCSGSMQIQRPRRGGALTAGTESRFLLNRKLNAAAGTGGNTAGSRTWGYRLMLPHGCCESLIIFLVDIRDGED